MKLPSDFKQDIFIHIGTGEHNEGELKVSEYSQPLTTSGFSTEVIGMIKATFDLSKSASLQLKAN